MMNWGAVPFPASVPEWLKLKSLFVAAGLVTIEQSILLVENNQDDILRILRAFQRAGVNRRIHAVTSGLEAFEYLQGTPPYGDREKYPLPALVLLDIKMPRKDGFEARRWILGQQEFFQ